MEERMYGLSAAAQIDRGFGEQANIETLTARLRRTLERAHNVASISDKLAFRIAGPRPQPIEKVPEVGSPDDDAVLMRLAEQVDAAVRQIENSIEWAHNRI